MTCIHGLDEINCPTCCMIRHSIPDNALEVKVKKIRSFNPFFRQDSQEKEQMLREIKPIHAPETPGIIALNLDQRLLTTLPEFKNEMFRKRMSEIDLSKSEKHGISKKISLESPEWKFE